MIINTLLFNYYFSNILILCGQLYIVFYFFKQKQVIDAADRNSLNKQNKTLLIFINLEVKYSCVSDEIEPQLILSSMFIFKEYNVSWKI